MQVVKYADEVTIPYLKKCIQHVYKGLDFSSKFTEKFYKVLLNDYQNKAYNLAWFLKEEETGRILNYREMTPTPEDIIKEGRKNQQFDYLLKFMDFKGVEWTNKGIIANKCTYKKQVHKISKLLPTLLVKEIPMTDISKEIPEFLISSIDSKATITTLGAFTYDENGLLDNFIPAEDITVRVGPALSEMGSSLIINHLSKLTSDVMKVSIDLADTLLAATGNTSSCFSTTGSYHLGTLISFRSDFTMLCFTHRHGDRFDKRGRTWLYNRVTEKGQIRNFSFFKFQKLYGTVSKAHLGLIEDFIYKRTEEVFKLPKTKFKAIDHSIDSGRDTNNDINNVGYIDTIGSEVNAWHVITDKHLDEFKLFSTETAIVFPEPINTDGNVSNNKNFNDLHRRTDRMSTITPKIYMVTCEITGEQEIDTACIQIDGKWYSKEGLRSVVGLEPIAQKAEVVESTPELVNDPDDVNDDLDDDDMKDF